jgi:hypothetical protein
VEAAVYEMSAELCYALLTRREVVG